MAKASVKYPLVRISDLTPGQIASICDHTFLNRAEAFRDKASKSGESAVRLCQKSFVDFLREMIECEIKPYALCIRPENVKFASDYLQDSLPDVKIASVVGFPDGNRYSTAAKMFEASLACGDGASEIDMVLNYDRLISADYSFVENDVRRVVSAAHSHDALVKVILETSELNDDHIIQACNICKECGADFVKTSTGFSSNGALPNVLKLMRNYFNKGVKMSGGVNAKNVRELLYAASGRDDGYIILDPMLIRIGESSLLGSLLKDNKPAGTY